MRLTCSMAIVNEFRTTFKHASEAQLGSANPIGLLAPSIDAQSSAAQVVRARASQIAGSRPPLINSLDKTFRACASMVRCGYGFVYSIN